jgi:1,2-diacylglycerol 3-alpha-glucosyltransferase
MVKLSELSIGMYTDTVLPRPDGIAVSIEAFGQALLGLGVRLELVGPKVRYTGTLPIRSIKSIRIPGRDYRIGLALPWLRSSRTAAASYNIVHVHTLGPIGLTGLAAAKFAGIPAILTWHTDIAAYRPYYPEVRLGSSMVGLTLARLGLDRTKQVRQASVLEQAISAFDLIIAPTEKARTQVSEIGCPRKTRVLASPTLPLPAPSMSPVATRRQMGIPRDAPVVLSIGRLSGEKNLELLIQAFALYSRTNPNAHLVLVGALRKRGDVMRLAAKLGVEASTHTPGVVGRNNLAAYYGLADVFVIPSLSETQSLVAQEAEAFGVPVIVVDEGLVAGQGTPRLFSKPNADSLACAIRQGVAEASPRRFASYPSADQFLPHAQTQAERLSEIYLSVIRGEA